MLQVYRLQVHLSPKADLQVTWNLLTCNLYLAFCPQGDPLPQVTLTIATSLDLPDLVRFFRAVAAAEAPDDPAAVERGEAGLRRSLEAWDFLRSDTCPLLLARLDGAPVGYLLAVRIPKADARGGFLFVDEVYVLPAYRCQGVARALLERVQALAGELGLAGVRLLVREENPGARKLYRNTGFVEHSTLFCEWKIGQGDEEKGRQGEVDIK
jgi:ribosomal protein S18 acetylase RimI-like enzyme